MTRIDSHQKQAAKDLAAVIHRSHDDILARWKEQVRTLPGARGLPEPLLQDEVAELLRELARHLEEAADTGSTAAHKRREARAAAAHGVERLRAGFDIEEVVAEYNLLRALIFDASAAMQLPRWLIGIIDDIVDRSVGTAVKTYAHQHALEERRRRAEHIAFVTHEMRNPLAALSAATEALRAGTGPPPAGITQTLQQSIGRLDKLIRELIEESRQIGGDLARENHPSVMKLYPLVEAIITDMDGPAQRAGMVLQNEVSEDLQVCADPNMLDIVVANLVKNAIDHSGARHLAVGARREGATSVCWIEDDGRGLPPEQRRVIFEPYAARGDAGGSGLGLYIAKRFMEAQDGTITAHSDGAGVRFELRLPACRDA